MSAAHALIVDDEADIRELVEITLSRMDIESTTAATLAEAEAALGAASYDFCITDMRLPDGDGIELVRRLQRDFPDTPVAVITAYGNAEAAVESLKAGAFDFVSKPVNLSVLRKLVDSALRSRRSDTPEAPGDVLLGASPQMNELRSLIDRVARSQAPVHVNGESGTGKELVARTVHARGPRATGPFVPVNCGAIPAELMESEFFGHRKGSFTGASADKQGLFQAAEGGTLFLDEVAELPLHMQVKLLRAVQERAIRPIGAQTEIEVNVRVISATHRDLLDMVEQGRFRQDLFYRLNVIEVRVPPLRERGQDVATLSDAILEKLARDHGLDRLPRLSADARTTLRGYHFPGNVRELENILERAVTLCEAEEISPDDLLLRDREGDPGTGEPNAALPQQLETVEREAILRALEKTRYNKTRAAELLGMSFRSLRYRIKKLRIE